MAQHIGIVACSAEGAALCYRTICVEGADIMGAHQHPEVSMHTHSLGEYMDYIYKNDWQGVAALMISSAKKLASIGANFLICPDNTIHQVFTEVASKSPLPWLHIAEEIAKKGQQYSSIGVLGTKYLMESEVYPEKFSQKNIETIIPTEEQRLGINDIIFKELVYGVFKDSSRNYFSQVIDSLKERGCQAVVLGCTEIPLLVTEESSSLPTLDSTRTLARSALQEATK